MVLLFSVTEFVVLLFFFFLFYFGYLRKSQKVTKRKPRTQVEIIPRLFLLGFMKSQKSIGRHLVMMEQLVSIPAPSRKMLRR